MLGWKFPPDASFANFVDHVALYPVTVIRELNEAELERLSGRGLMLCRQLADLSPAELAKSAKIPSGRAGKIIESCRNVIAPQAGEAEAHRGFTTPKKGA